METGSRLKTLCGALATTPTMVSHRPASSGMPIWMRLPMGSASPGHQRRAQQTPGEERNVHGLEIVRAHRLVAASRQVARFRRLALDGENAPGRLAVVRHGGYRHGGPHPGNGARPFQDLAIEFSLLVAFAVFVFADLELQREHGGGFVPRTARGQRLEAADHQARPHQQHHGQRDLHRHQDGPQAVFAAPGPRGRPPAAAAFLERIVDVRPRTLPRRRQARQDAAQHRRRQREGQRAAVERDVFESQDVLFHFGRHAGPVQVEAPACHQQAEGSAHERKQNAFGEELLPGEARGDGVDFRRGLRRRAARFQTAHGLELPPGARVALVGVQSQRCP